MSCANLIGANLIQTDLSRTELIELI
ncbi:pentapeptide repeat-containing protein [Streptococcus halichoeri]